MKVPELVGRSGSMLLHFYSDVAYNMTGFNITFSVDACPTENTELTCSGHGTCDPSSGNCSCDQDFKGAACSVPACPGNCGNGGTGTALISCHIWFSPGPECFESKTTLLDLYLLHNISQNFYIQCLQR